MTVIEFTPAFKLKESAVDKLVNKKICIELKIPVEELAFWIHFITHRTHSTGFHLQKASLRIQKLLQRDFNVLEDLQSKMLMFTGFEEDIQFSLTFEEVIVVEAQLERFIDECQYFNDYQYIEIAQKYMNTLYGIMEASAQEFDYMTKYMIKASLCEK